MVIINQAKAEDAERALKFYYDLIDDMEGEKYRPKWEKGIYPVLGELRTAASEGNLFLAESDGNVIGAFIVNNMQNPGYSNVHWTYEAEPNKIAVIHLLATAPSFQKHGLGKKLLTAAVDVSRKRGNQVIRLDTLTWNIPAQRLYEGFGFHCCGDVDLDYKTTGKIPFRVYEYKCG